MMRQAKQPRAGGKRQHPQKARERAVPRHSGGRIARIARTAAIHGQKELITEAAEIHGVAAGAPTPIKAMCGARQAGEGARMGDKSLPMHRMRRPSEETQPAMQSVPNC